MVKIKICGIKSLDTVDVLNAELPDFIGFVFAKNSVRAVNKSEAESIGKQLDSKIKKVGVFVNEDIKSVADLCNSGIIDVVQLHGNEDDEYVDTLKKLVDKDIIKAVKVDKNASIVGTIPKRIDGILFDYYSKTADGGAGKSFDWSRVDFTKYSVPVFLAGGIDESNINKALSLRGVYCIDCSSGAETDGQKDPQKITALINAVRK